MAEPAREETREQLLEARAAEEVGDRRRWRRALAAAVAVHLLVLLAPRPRPEPAPQAPAGEPSVYLLREVRFAPPAPPPSVAPEDEPETADEATELEPETAPPGPPPPPRVEVLFPEGDLSRLVPPRPLQAVPPPTPAGAPVEGGEVRIYLQLDAEGKVYGVRAAGGDPALLQAALVAAKGWVFFPATLDAQPIPVVVEVVVRFPPPAATAEPPAATGPPPR